MASSKRKPPKKAKTAKPKKSKGFSVQGILQKLQDSKVFTPELAILMLFGALLMGVLFLQLENFQWLAPGLPVHIPKEQWNFLFIVAFLILAYGYRTMPVSEHFEMPRWAAYPLLLVVLGTAAFLRLYHLGDPVPTYWDDEAMCVIDPRNVIDLHDFKITFPIGLREPLHGYVTALVWVLLPGLKPIVIQRLAACLFDLLAVYVFYLLGREVSGKRMGGVLLAALGAVSKPMIMQNLCGMGGVTLTLGVSLLLLFQNRVFREPKFSHFIGWGLAIAFGIYTYISIRPWVLFLTAVTILWILWTRRKDKVQWKPLGLLALFALGYFMFYLDKLLYIFHGNPISAVWGGNGALWFGIQVAFLAGLIWVHNHFKGREKQLASLGLGLLLAGFLVHPLAMDPGISFKIRDIGMKNPFFWFTPTGFSQIKTEFLNTITSLFVWGPDRADMNVVNDAFFDYHAVIWVMLGLAYAAARPSWIKGFFVLCALVGIVPHVMTSDPQSAKMLGSMPPLMLLGALAFQHWINGALSSKGLVRAMGVLLIAGTGAFWVWEGKGTFQRIYGDWWRITSPDVFVSREVTQLLPDHRVYLVPYGGMGFMSPAVQGVLHDGDPVYLFKNNENVIDVPEGEKRPDVAVIVFMSDHVVMDRLKKEFPKAVWNGRWQYYQTPGVGNAFMNDVVIPASEIPEKPGKLFRFRTVPAGGWKRRIYVTYYGLSRGMIQSEDISPTLNPVGVEAGAHSVSGEGVWEAPVDGTYSFAAYTPDVTQVFIDGQLVLGLVPGGSGAKHANEKAFFKKGPHQVLFLSFLKVNLIFPRITIKEPTTHYEQILGNPPGAL